MDIKTIGVEDWLNVWEKSATYDIAQSTIASMTMGEILQLDGQAGATFYDRLNQEKMNYGWIEGSPEFKAEVAKLYRTEIDLDCILQTNGTTGANLMALMQLVEPGDHVIAEYPTYQPLYEIPRTLGAEVEYWHLREENGWNPSIDELKELVRPDTKLRTRSARCSIARRWSRSWKSPSRWVPTCSPTRCTCRWRTRRTSGPWPTCTIALS